MDTREALCPRRGRARSSSHLDRQFPLLLGCPHPPRLDLGLSSFGTQPRPPLGPLGPALISPHQLPSRCDLVKPPPYSRHFQTVQHLSSNENSQEALEKADQGKGALAEKGGVLETQVPSGAPHQAPQDSPQALLHAQEVLEAPSEDEPTASGCWQIDLEKHVHRLGSLCSEASGLRLCRQALREPHSPRRFCPTRHVGYCHLVIFRNLVALKALICNKGLCQHFCSEFLFSMICNEASF